jgi:hypothetical protein
MTAQSIFVGFLIRYLAVLITYQNIHEFVGEIRYLGLAHAVIGIVAVAIRSFHMAELFANHVGDFVGLRHQFFQFTLLAYELVNSGKIKSLTGFFLARYGCDGGALETLDRRDGVAEVAQRALNVLDLRALIISIVICHTSMKNLPRFNMACCCENENAETTCLEMPSIRRVP